MTRIKELADEMKDELHSAKCYAEEYLTFKAKDKNTWATRYKEMAQDELKHAGYIHERVVAEIDELRKVYTPPQEMLDKWDTDHKKYIEKAAWIKQMLTM
jgi:bacterioferritin (cytochrome b1)